MSTALSQSVSPDSDAKTHAIAAYVLLIFGLFTAIPMLFGAVWAMIKKSDSAGTVYYSHYCNATRTFWWTLLWTIIGCILSVVVIGYGILAAVWIWAFYRLVNGFAKITSDIPYPL